MTELTLILEEPLEQRVSDFKEDPEKVKQVNAFLNELFEKARIEAELRQDAKKNKLETLGLQNGSKRIGIWSSRARSSARSLATRVFTAICNCTTTVRNATNAAINRNNS